MAKPTTNTQDMNGDRLGIAWSLVVRFIQTVPNTPIDGRSTMIHPIFNAGMSM
jgi:hypothetical protein